MSLKFLPYCAADRSRTHPGRLGCSWSSLQTPQDSGPLRQTEQTTRHWIETVCFTGVKQALTLHHPPISTLCVTDIQISESFQMPLITLKEVISLLLARGCQSVSQNTILHMQKSCWIYRIIALWTKEQSVFKNSQMWSVKWVPPHILSTLHPRPTAGKACSKRGRGAACLCSCSLLPQTRAGADSFHDTPYSSKHRRLAGCQSLLPVLSPRWI